MAELVERFHLEHPPGVEENGAWLLPSADGLLLLGTGVSRREPELLQSVLVKAGRLAFGADGLVQATVCGFLNDQVVIGYPLLGATSLTNSSLDESRLELAFRALADCLGRLHEVGVAHGHLRPELVRLTPERTELLGFGAAAVCVALADQRRAIAMQPAPYRAPELEGATTVRHTAATDTYALAAMLLECWLGQPLDADQTVQSPRAYGVDLGDECESLLRKGLSRSPAQRPSNLRSWVAEVFQAKRRLSALALGGQAAPDPARSTAAALNQPTRESFEPDGTQLATESSAQPKPQSVHAPDGYLPPAEPQPRPVPLPSKSRRDFPWGIIVAAFGVLILLGGATALGVMVYVRHSPASATPAVPPATVIPAPPSFPPMMPPGTGTVAPFGSSPPPPVASSSKPPSGPHPVVAPAGPLVQSDTLLPVAGAPFVGRIDAPVTLVIFGDLQCPHTRRLLPELAKLRTAFGDDLRLVWRNRPMSRHREAQTAAQVIVGLARDGKGSDVFRLFQEIGGSRDAPTKERLEHWMSSAGLSLSSKVSSWIVDSDTKLRVDRDLQQAGIFRVFSTPTLFLNGQRLRSQRSFRRLESAVKREMVAARALVGSGVLPKDVYRLRVRKNLIGVGETVSARSCPTVGSSPSRGAKNPLVTLVEFSDFQCPFCARAQISLERVLARHGGDLKIVWKHFPLSSHKRARAAAGFAHEAMLSGGLAKFWRAHDLLFAKQRDLSDETLKEIADKLGLPSAALLQAANDDAHAKSIDADVKEGRRLGVRGTPTLFVNGRRLNGLSSDAAFARLVREEIEWARRVEKSGVDRGRLYAAICGR